MPTEHPAARALRDALGLVRMLYAAEADEARRAILAKAGEHLSVALDFTTKRPDSLGYRAVYGNATKGFNELNKLTWSEEVLGLLKAARARVEQKKG